MSIDILTNYTFSHLYDVSEQLKSHIYDRSLAAFRKGDKDRDNVNDKDSLKSRQVYMREKLIESIGGLPPTDTPLNAKTTGVLSCSGYQIEKVIFESRPENYVTGNLYIPNDITSPSGAVLFMCGHSEQGKQNPQYQMVCQYLVQSGLIVFAIDPIGQGERLSYYESDLQMPTIKPCTIEHDYAGSQCLPIGDNLAKYFVHDGMRAIDYLCQRSEVDPNRIGVTGNSGGGTQTSLMMICDQRIAAAAPGTFIMNRETYMYAGGAQDAEQIWPGMTALGFDHEDILMSMVPRPVRVLAAQYDYFPIEGTRRTVDRVSRFWQLFDQGENIDLVEDASVHSYSQNLAKAAGEFFAKHLLDRKVDLEAFTPSPFPPSALWCTSSGQIRQEFKKVRSVYEENVDRLEEVNKCRANKDSKAGVAWLQKQVMHARKPVPLNLRIYPVGQWEEVHVQSLLWWSQEGILNHGFLMRDFRNLNKKVPFTIAIWDGGTKSVKSHMDWIKTTCRDGRAVLILDTSGVGALKPVSNDHDDSSFYGIIHKLTTDLFWLNDSLAALRTYDVLRAMEVSAQIPDIESDKIQLYANGRHSLYAQMAAVLDNRNCISDLIVENGMKSIADWVGERHYNAYDIMSIIVPGMLTYMDLPEINEVLSERNMKVNS